MKTTKKPDTSATQIVESEEPEIIICHPDRTTVITMMVVTILGAVLTVCLPLLDTADEHHHHAMPIVFKFFTVGFGVFLFSLDGVMHSKVFCQATL